MTAQPCPEATYRTKRYAKGAAWTAALATARANGNTHVQPQPVEFCIRCNAWHVVGPQPTTTKGRV